MTPSFRLHSVTVLAALLVGSAPLFAAEVSSTDAARAAMAWVDRGYAMGKLPAGRTVAGVDELRDPATGARMLVARFEGGGYVVLSADDRVDPVLAFSETGEGVDPDERNPFWALLRAGIAARERAAGVVREAPAPAQAGAAEEPTAAPAAGPTAAQRRWADLLAEEKCDEAFPTALAAGSVSDLRVDALVQSRWGQSKAGGKTCWNYYTPKNYVCGCVATAISQVMRHWREPSGEVTPNTYTCWVNYSSVNKTMMGGYYDWNNMPLTPSYSSIPTENQCRAMGKLAYDVGVSVQMQWTSGGSGAILFAGMPALKEDFGYSSAVAILFGSSTCPWSLETFKQAVCPNFDAGCPVILGISYVHSGMRDNGHAVVADGYGFSDGDFYIHVNYGWSGSGDAWYCPPALSTSGYEFNEIEGLVCNVFPEKEGNLLSGRVLNSSGAPASGASVTLSDGQTTTTDVRGIYAFYVDPGAYTVSATKNGSSAKRSATVGPTSPLVLFGREGMYSPAPCRVGNSWGNDLTLSGPVSSAPSAPSWVSASDGDFTDRVQVEWASSEGATSYAVYRAESASGTKTFLGSTDSTSWSDTSATAGTTYYYWVKASNASGTSGFSDCDSGVRGSTPSLGSIRTEPGTTTATFYVSVTALGAGSEWVDVDVTVGETTRTQRVTADGAIAEVSFTGLSAGTSYTATVVATGSNGLSTTTRTARFATHSYEAPTISSVTATGTGATTGRVVVDVSSLGQGNTGAKISVYLSTTGSFGSSPKATRTISATGSQTVDLTGLAAGAAYSVKVVVAGTPTGLSATDTGASFRTDDPIVEAPVLGTVSVASGTTTATFSISVAKLGAGSDWVEVDVTVNGTTLTETFVADGAAAEFSFSGLAAGAAYTATVVATGSNGLSTTRTVTFATRAYEPPTISSATATGTGETTGRVIVGVSSLGNGNTGATISVYLSTTGTFGSSPKATRTITSTGSQTFDLTGLSAGTTYFVKVAAAGTPTGLSATDAGASFRTDDPIVEAPVLGTVSVASGTTTAVFSIPVTELGAGSDWADVDVTVNGTTLTQRVTADGTVAEVSLPDLTAGTAYTATIVATGSNGLSTTRTLTFTTLAYEAPVISSMTATGTGETTGRVVVDVSSLGDGNSGAKISVYLSTTGTFGAWPKATRTISATGSQTFDLTGLSAGTTYFVKVVAAGTPTGLSSADAWASFRTDDPTVEAPVLGRVSVASETTNATFSVPVTKLGLGSDWADVAVTVDGTTRTQRATADGAVAEVFFPDLAAGTLYTARVVATGSNGLSSDVTTVRFRTRPYTPPAISIVSAAETGETSGRIVVDVSSLGRGNTGATLSVYLSATEEFESAPVETRTISSTGLQTFDLAGLSIGTAYSVKVVATGAPTGLSAVDMGSFATDARDDPVIGDVSISAGTTTANFSIAVASLGKDSIMAFVQATIDDNGSKPKVLSSPGTVTATLSGLSPGTTYTAKIHVEGSNGRWVEMWVIFSTQELLPPVLTSPEKDGVAPLGFDQGPDGPLFVVRIGNAVPGAYYTLYQSDSVGGPFKAVKSEASTSDGLKEFSIDASPSSKFIRIGVSDSEIPIGTEL